MIFVEIILPRAHTCNINYTYKNSKNCDKFAICVQLKNCKQELKFQFLLQSLYCKILERLFKLYLCEIKQGNVVSNSK